MSPARPSPSGRTGAAGRRRERQREILTATRALFDERGLRDAQIDDIAKAVGINRAIVYRHFVSKDELFGLVLVDYLTDLDADLASAARPDDEPGAQLRALAEVFVDFCLAHPAFSDCALSLLRRPGADLPSEMSDQALFVLGRTLGTTLGRIAEVLRRGIADGVFHATPDDADLLANVLYAQGLGAVHLARAGFVVTAGGSGSTFAPVPDDRVREAAVRGILATARGA